MTGIELLKADSREAVPPKATCSDELRVRRGDLSRDRGRCARISVEEHAAGRDRQPQFKRCIAGRRHIPPRIAARLAERMVRSALTQRELEILEMVVRGLTNKQIGNALRISENTARNHINSIIRKLDVSGRTEAATAAIQQGLVRMPD